MEKIRKGIIFGVVASESIHIFCCILPTLFSVLSLLAGMGVIATMPGLVDEAHHMIHSYEIPMIMASAIILIIGWALLIYARRMDCSSEGEGCCAKPCAPKKDRTKIIMIGASFLFIVNVTVYFGFHHAQETHLDIYEFEHYSESYDEHHNHDHY